MKAVRASLRETCASGRGTQGTHIACARPLVLLVLLACADPTAAPFTPGDRDASVPPEAEARDAGEVDAADEEVSRPPADADEVGMPDARTAAPVDDASADDLEPPEQERSSLVRPELWQRVGPEQDPFADRPALVLCSGTATMAETLAEEEVFSVDTEGCNYLTAIQPTSREVAAGETIKVRLWHFELQAPEPAEAHAALFVGDEPVLDEQVAIPQAGGLIVRELTVGRAIPAGAPVYFHLHNHGENSWALVEVSAGP